MDEEITISTLTQKQLKRRHDLINYTIKWPCEEVNDPKVYTKLYFKLLETPSFTVPKELREQPE